MGALSLSIPRDELTVLMMGLERLIDDEVGSILVDETLDDFLDHLDVDRVQTLLQAATRLQRASLRQHGIYWPRCAGADEAQAGTTPKRISRAHARRFAIQRGGYA